MSHTQKEKKALLNRVRRLRGQLDGLERALEEEQGCYEVLQQIAAVRRRSRHIVGQRIGQENDDERGLQRQHE